MSVQIQQVDEQANSNQLLEKFEVQQKALKSNLFPDIKLRKHWLDQLNKLVRENENAIIKAIDKDFSGRSNFETRVAEIYPALKSIKHT